MGLDACFYKKRLFKNTDIPIEEVLKDIHFSTNKNLQKQIIKLKNICDITNEDFEYNLTRAIEYYIDNNYNNISNGEEVGYFRKFWWLNNYLNYTDDNYAEDKPITKEQLQELKNLAEKTIIMVEKHFSEQGLIVNHSPLNKNYTPIRYSGIRPELIVFKNGLFTEAKEKEADNICKTVFNSDDNFLFSKVCDLYKYTKDMLENTDFEKEQIVYNADW